jgi:striatin 1/3/4
VTLPDESNEKQILTAIYRPDSKAAWREELRAANEQAEKVSIPQGQ